MTTPRVTPRVTEAAQVLFDNTGTGIAATELQAATVELDGRSIFLRQMTLSADFTVQSGYFAVWMRPRIPDTTRLSVKAGSRLRTMA